MNRRGFLSSILALGAAPYVMSNGIASGILMPVRKLWTPASIGLVSILSINGVVIDTIPVPENKVHFDPMNGTYILDYVQSAPIRGTCVAHSARYDVAGIRARTLPFSQERSMICGDYLNVKATLTI